MIPLQYCLTFELDLWKIISNFWTFSQGVPNLDSRFGGEDTPSSNGAGISTSSFSSSSDVNGKATHSGGSQTVINKDGKTHVFTHRLWLIYLFQLVSKWHVQ